MTTTFTSIGFTFFGGLLVLCICLLLFAMALRKQSQCIAPRATARPRTVIHCRQASVTSVQYRGNVVFGWMIWTLRLSYDTLLRGVPGTGTRQGGLSGRMLQTNLDGIVLLRFHAIGRRVAVVATILCMGVLLPLYCTSPVIDCSDVVLTNTTTTNDVRIRFLTDQAASFSDVSDIQPNSRPRRFHHKKHRSKTSEATTATTTSSTNNNKLLPSYDPYILVDDDEYHVVKHYWNDPCHAPEPLTDYGKTTLARVPVMIQESYLDQYNYYLNYKVVNIAVRLYAVVAVLWILTLHVLYLLKQEWIDLLALRRVYYLEANVYQERREEVWPHTPKSSAAAAAAGSSKTNGNTPAVTMPVRKKSPRHKRVRRRGSKLSTAEKGELYKTSSTATYTAGTTTDNIEQDTDVEDEDTASESDNNMEDYDLDESSSNMSLMGGLLDHHHHHGHDDDELEEDFLITNREPWIPHPENPDTVAHIGLYSLLVGNLPTLPEAMIAGEDSLHPEAHSHNNPIYSHLSSKRDSIDWQLQLTSSFFDYCVPNQPGFSSSVAAVSILPGAGEIAASWQKWYAAAAKLRRLRFIRKQIERRKRQHILRRRLSLTERGLAASERSVGHDFYGSKWHDESETDVDGSLEMVDLKHANSSIGHSFHNHSDNDDIRNRLGPIVSDDANNKVYKSITFGPEQTAIYGREFAQAASPFCPNGFCEERIASAGLEDLLDYEEEAAIQLHYAICELQDVRCHVSAMAVDERGNPLNGTTVSPPARGGKKGYKSVTKSSGERSELSRSGSQMETDLLETSGHSKRRNAQKWDLLESIADEARENEYMQARKIPNGVWAWPTCSGLFSFLCLKDWRKYFQTENAMESLARESTFAVVTFTSRQAAIAARHCLSDGRAYGRWSNLHEIPIAPLSDAAPCNIWLCRNWCRPVTLSISDSQKTIRFYLTLVCLACLYVFYTIPLTFASSLVNPEVFEQLFPFLAGTDFPDMITGFLSAMVWSIFFMICPQLFRTIANIGSVATSVAKAELRALQYFWWFMVFTAFTGPILAQWVLNAIDNDFQFGAGLREALRLIAGATATVVSANWLNWIIYRFTIIIPLHYLLQFNTFLFQILGLKWVARLTIGGGPGGPIPYRIFVDSGVVIMCTVALAPVCPVIAPAALMYFFVCEPIIRRNLVFVYRPRYDDGGLRWIFLFDMIISGLIMAQVLLSIQMTLKNAYGPMLISVCAIPVTLLFSYYCKRKYSRAFHDAALLQTALLDGWDKSNDMSLEEREQYRRFLVDAHKAAYIPVCIAGADTGDFLTAEPAIVVPRGLSEETDESPTGSPLVPTQLPDTVLRSRSFSADHAGLVRQQPGVTLRRADSGVAAWLEGQDRDEPYDNTAFVPDMIDDFLSPQAVPKKKIK